MRVAINTFPLKSGHKNRGTGYYTRYLLEYLKKNGSVEIEEFSKLSSLKDVDVVHYPWFDLYFHTLPIIKRFPTIVTIHDVIPLLFPKYYPVGWKGRINLSLQKLALGNCKFIITDSQSSKIDILKYLKVSEEKIIVIPLAADSIFRVLNNPQPLRIKRKYNLPNQFLMYVGDANWSKNLSFLIDGFRQ